jgi:uncharacterized membrane protein YgaE (UPF0421/DUF939 family)
MLGRLTRLDARLYPALLRSLTFVGAAVAILLCYRALELAGESWAITSVALVMQTQAIASLRVAAIRVFINVVSATVALLALHLGGTTIPSFAVALLVVGLFCYLSNLDDGVRSAYICVVIIIGADSLAVLSPPIERVAAVTVGSALGVAVSWVFAKIEAWSSARMDGKIAH